MQDLESLGAAHAALVGHSMGALVALECAARHPERIAALAMLGVSIPMAVSDGLLAAAAANDHSAVDMITIWGHGFGARVGRHPVPGMWMTGGALRVLEGARPRAHKVWNEGRRRKVWGGEIVVVVENAIIVITVM